MIGLPDERSGERVCAVVAIAEGQETLVMAEMVEFLKGEGLMVQKVPEQLEIVDVHPAQPRGQDPQERPARALHRLTPTEPVRKSGAMTPDCVQEGGGQPPEASSTEPPTVVGVLLTSPGLRL